jgi:hypothetical protein
MLEYEELNGAAVSALYGERLRKLSNVGQLLDGYQKSIISGSSMRHVKPLVLAAFAIVSSHEPVLSLRSGLLPFLFMCNP